MASLTGGASKEPIPVPQTRTKRRNRKSYQCCFSDAERLLEPLLEEHKIVPPLRKNRFKCFTEMDNSTENVCKEKTLNKEVFSVSENNVGTLNSREEVIAVNNNRGTVHAGVNYVDVHKIDSKPPLEYNNSEENDSGVYFSEPKSYPENEPTYFTKEPNLLLLHNDSSVELSATPTPISSLWASSDSVDNKPLVRASSPVSVLLDDFEAQTVSSFREEMMSQFAGELWESSERSRNNLLMNKYLKDMINESPKDDITSKIVINGSCKEDRLYQKYSNHNNGSKAIIETVFKDVDLSQSIIDEVVKLRPIGYHSNINNGKSDLNNSSVINSNFDANSDVYDSNVCLKDYDSIISCHGNTFTDDKFHTDVVVEFGGANIIPQSFEMNTVESGCLLKDEMDSDVWLDEEAKLGKTNSLNENNLSSVEKVCQTYSSTKYMPDSASAVKNFTAKNSEDQFGNNYAGDVLFHCFDISNSANCGDMHITSEGKELPTELQCEAVQNCEVLSGPARIPVMLLTRPSAPLLQGQDSSHIGTVELHPIQHDDSVEQQGVILREEPVTESGGLENVGGNITMNAMEEFEVSVEKIWGTLGIMLKVCTDHEDSCCVAISDVLPGGAADMTELIKQGFLSSRRLDTHSILRTGIWMTVEEWIRMIIYI